MVELLKAFALTGGEWVIYILIFCSVLGVAIIIERAMIFSKEKKQQKFVKALFQKGVEGSPWPDLLQEFQKTSGLAAKVLTAGISQMSKGSAGIEEHMVSVSLQEKQRLDLRMIVLGTLGNNAIYIGLFGTVLGVIKAFHDLAQESGAGPEVVMKGLSEALIATAAGLLVAIPCVIAYNYFQKQIKDLLSETESMSRLLIAYQKSEKKS